MKKYSKHSERFYVEFLKSRNKKKQLLGEKKKKKNVKRIKF